MKLDRTVWQVHGYNKATFASCDSPKFGTYGECRKWINERIFDTGVELEIREMKVATVEYSEYDTYDPRRHEFTSDRYARMLVENGCVSNAMVRLKRGTENE